jgi:hypothetical protein
MKNKVAPLSFQDMITAESERLLTDFSEKNISNLAVITPRAILFKRHAGHVPKKLFEGRVLSSFNQAAEYFNQNPDINGTCNTWKTGDQYTQVIMLNDKGRKKIRDRIRDFDHEVGHILYRGQVSDSKNMQEMTPDVYAWLRQYQRFGNFFNRREWSDLQNAQTMCIIGNTEENAFYYNLPGLYALIELEKTPIFERYHYPTPSIRPFRSRGNMRRMTTPSSRCENLAHRYVT